MKDLAISYLKRMPTRLLGALFGAVILSTGTVSQAQLRSDVSVYGCNIVDSSASVNGATTETNFGSRLNGSWLGLKVPERTYPSTGDLVPKVVSVEIGSRTIQTNVTVTDKVGHQLLGLVLTNDLLKDYFRGASQIVIRSMKGDEVRKKGFPDYMIYKFQGTLKVNSDFSGMVVASASCETQFERFKKLLSLQMHPYLYKMM